MIARGRGLRWVSRGLLVAGSVTVANVASYGAAMVAARWLGPSQYSAFAALRAIVVLVNVLSLGLQATAARSVARNPERATVIARTVLSAAWRAAAALALACVALSPVLATLLHVGDWASVAAVAMPAAAMAVLGAQLGLLQGRERWARFAWVNGAMGLGRVLGVVLGLLVWPHPLGAIVGVGVGAVLPVLLARGLLGRPARVSTPSTAGTIPTAERRQVLREVGHSSHMLFAFYALTTVDMLLARGVLNAHEAGLYAAGQIVSKAVLFLPSFVTILVFPMLSRRGSGVAANLHLHGVAAVALIGSLCVLATWAAPGLALRFAGGDAYSGVGPQLWLFALLGTVLAMNQLLVQTAIARRRTAVVWWVWAALGVFAGAFLGVRDHGDLLRLVLATDAVLCVGLLVLVRHPEGELIAGASPAAEVVGHEGARGSVPD